jgi:glutathione S-transferase
MTVTLIGLAYSPWTEKARWALEHAGIAYRYEEHLMIFGLPRLALVTRTSPFRATVPVLLTGERVIFDSFAIARWADQNRKMGSSLFPPEHEADLLQWNARSERACEAGRVCVTERLLLDPKAQEEALPDFIAMPLRGSLRWMARFGAQVLQWEFGYQASQAAQARERLREVYQELRTQLAGRETIFPGGFSVADLVMAVTLQWVAPYEHGRVNLRPATRRTWSDPELAREFSDLVEWRDRLKLTHGSRFS